MPVACRIGMTKLQAKGGASTLSHQPRENFRVAEEGAMLVGVELPDRPLDDYPEPMAELRGLAQTAGAKVLGMAIQNAKSPTRQLMSARASLRKSATRFTPTVPTSSSLIMNLNRHKSKT